MIYLYLLGEYTDNDFTLPSLNKGMKVRRAYNVVTKQKIGVRQKGKVATLKGVNPVKNDLTVIAVELNKSVR